MSALPTADSPQSSPEALRILPATPADAGLLCELIRELAAFEHLSEECLVTPEKLLAHLWGEGRAADAVLAWLGGEAVGYAVYYRTFSTFLGRPGVYLEDLYVRPAFRKRGFGRALLREVGRIAHCSDAGRYEWTTLEWNRNARQLYASIGAREMRDWLLLRMEAEELADFACDGRARKAGEGPKAEGSCRCGGKGHGHGHGDCMSRQQG